MASELRVNSSTNRSGLGTITYTDSGPIVSGVGTFTNGLTVDGTQTTVKSLKLTGDNYNANWFKTTNKLRFNDNAKATFGTSDDLSIFHNASDSVITHGAGGTGNLKILSGGAQSIECIKAGAVNIAHNGSTKLATSSTGVSITGGVTASGASTFNEDVTFIGDSTHLTWDRSNRTLQAQDNVYLKFGTQGDYQIYHDGSNAVHRVTGDGDLKLLVEEKNFIVQGTGGHQIIKGIDNGAVELYHNNTKRLETFDNSPFVGISVAYDVVLNSTADSAYRWAVGGNASSNFKWSMFYSNSSSSLNIFDNVNSRNMASFKETGAIELNYQASKKFETTTNGIQVTGRADPTTDSTYDLGTNATRWRTLYADTINISANGNNTNGTVANFRGGVYNQINIAHANNSGWGLLLTNTDQSTYGSNSGYHFSTNTSINKPCAVVNVNSDSLHFGTANTSRFFLTNAGHFLPYANNSYDIGGSSNRVRNIYTNDLNLSNEGSTNSVDNTWGDYTIQEGESDLFLINNRSGKKYKFNLTEVS